MSKVNDDLSGIYKISLDRLDRELNSILDKMLSTSSLINEVRLTFTEEKTDKESKDI